MEIFQTIWAGLTTENEVLTNIIGVPSIFIESYISILLFTTLLNINRTKKQTLLYVIICSTFGTFSSLILPNPYNTFINLGIVLLSILIIFKTNILKAFICLLFPPIITAFFETILAKLYPYMFDIDYYAAFDIPIHRIFSTAIVYSIMFLIYLLIKYLRLNISKLNILDKKKKMLLVFNAIFGVILICMQLYVTAFYISNLPFGITMLSIITLFIYFIISLYTTFTSSELEATSTNLEEAQLYNKTLEILQDNTRAFRHDFTNILLGMTGYMDRNDMEGLKKYHSQLLDDIKQVNNLTTLSPKLVNNPAVYNVLASKYHKADSLGIKINLEVFLDLNDLHMKIYEFTRILGILMDNAIEATSECEDKIINVSIRKNTKKHMQLLQIENTYKDKEINTDKIFEKGYSTKEGNTGLGLWEIRQILKKNNNLNLYTSKDETYFSQQLEIYY